ncbi:hypothetical protein BGZ82_002063, partial [Podila clonocystis]
ELPGRVAARYHCRAGGKTRDSSPQHRPPSTEEPAAKQPNGQETGNAGQSKANDSGA